LHNKKDLCSVVTEIHIKKAGEKMKKILMRETGSVDVLYEVEASIPEIADHELLIKMAATSVNHFDLVIRKGEYFSTIPKEMQPTFPHLLGLDLSGVVEKVGKDVKGFNVGDHVIGLNRTGTYAEYVVANPVDITKITEKANLEKIAGFPVITGTAWSATVKNGQIKAGERVLVHGGAGGVGQMAIQFAKKAGAVVYTTASEKNREYLLNLGADVVIDYLTTDFTDVVRDIDLVIDTVGGKTLDNSYQVLKRGGRLISVSMPPNVEKAAQYEISASFVRGELPSDVIQEIVEDYTNGKIKLNIANTFNFDVEDVKRAHLSFDDRAISGKLLIVMGAK